MELILASNSPRRKELLADCGFSFKVVVSDYEEKAFSTDPIETSVQFAIGKAKAVFNQSKDKNVCVVGADTVVFNQGVILNKPKDDLEATNMLKFLSGKTHCVITGYCVINKDKMEYGYDQTFVTFNALSDYTISEYVKSGLYKGKSGSYGIQDPFPLVKEYKGSINNVIGLPTEKLKPLIKQMIK
jgi:septum formation protein